MESLLLRIALSAMCLLGAPGCGEGDPTGSDRPPFPDTIPVPPDFLQQFTVLQDLDWDAIPSGWYHHDNAPGALTADGRLTWFYPAGDIGGDTPGTRVILEGSVHGPFQYHREEGLELSEGFHGHASGVNKLRFWLQANGNTSGYLMLEGSGSGDLYPSINTQGWPMGLRVLRWDDVDNLASPARDEATISRGERHTMETLVYAGTPGRADGFVRLWLDGVLVLHFEGLALRAENQPALFGGIHYAPVWGGINDAVPGDMTLSIDRTLVAFAEEMS